LGPTTGGWLNQGHRTDAPYKSSTNLDIAHEEGPEPQPTPILQQELPPSKGPGGLVMQPFSCLLSVEARVEAHEEAHEEAWREVCRDVRQNTHTGGMVRGERVGGSVSRGREGLWGLRGWGEGRGGRGRGREIEIERERGGE
jgi:hypothetical protein